MKGRQKGRPTKFVTAVVNEAVMVGKPGVTFEVWEKWKRNRKKLGTMTVSVGGLRWWPNNGRKKRPMSWQRVADWLENSD